MLATIVIPRLALLEKLAYSLCSKKEQINNIFYSIGITLSKPSSNEINVSVLTISGID